MKKLKSKYQRLIKWFIWLFLVILWNYGYPDASPLEDVIIAVVLSLLFTVLKKY